MLSTLVGVPLHTIVDTLFFRFVVQRSSVYKNNAIAVGRKSRLTLVNGYKSLEKKGTKWHIHGWFAIAGCYHGMRCGRSAQAVGEATTTAVVHSIVGIIVASAVITVICNVLKV